MKGPLKKTMQQRPGAPRFARERVRFLDLAEDFRFAHDYGIQAAHDSEKMPHTLLSLVAIEPAAILAGRDFSPGQTMRDLFRGDGITRGRIKYYAIARNLHHSRGATTDRTQRSCRSPRQVPLACLHVGRVMADAHTEKIHCIGRP